MRKKHFTNLVNDKFSGRAVPKSSNSTATELLYTVKSQASVKPPQKDGELCMRFNLGHCSISASPLLQVPLLSSIAAVPQGTWFPEREVIKGIKLIPGHQRSTGDHPPVNGWCYIWYKHGWGIVISDLWIFKFAKAPKFTVFPAYSNLVFKYCMSHY